MSEMEWSPVPREAQVACPPRGWGPATWRPCSGRRARPGSSVCSPGPSPPAGLPPLGLGVARPVPGLSVKWSDRRNLFARHRQASLLCLPGCGLRINQQFPQVTLRFHQSPLELLPTCCWPFQLTSPEEIAALPHLEGRISDQTASSGGLPDDHTLPSLLRSPFAPLEGDSKAWRSFLGGSWVCISFTSQGLKTWLGELHVRVPGFVRTAASVCSLSWSPRMAGRRELQVVTHPGCVCLSVLVVHSPVQNVI